MLPVRIGLARLGQPRSDRGARPQLRAGPAPPVGGAREARTVGHARVRADLVRAWCGHGVGIVWAWCGHGTCMVWAWHGHGTGLARAYRVRADLVVDEGEAGPHPIELLEERAAWLGLGLE